MSENVTETTDSNFKKDVLESDTPVIVDFWAPWCPPCKEIAPILDELADEYVGKVKVVKVNIDENPKSPADYKVRGIPNLLFFKGGELVEQVVGSVPKAELVKAIESKLV